MARIAVSLETLKHLDGGRSAIAIDHALKQIFQDLDDRGSDKKERKATIVIAAAKLGDNPDIYIDIRVKTALPSYDTASTIAKLVIGENGAVLAHFEPGACDNPDQGTIDWELREKARAAREAEHAEGETD